VAIAKENSTVVAKEDSESSEDPEEIAHLQRLEKEREMQR